MDALVKFFFEIGQLKREPRSGWFLAGIKNPESIADHSFRAALLGYFIALKKGLNAEKVVMMLLVHDIPETRATDLHKVATRYIDFKGIEPKIVEEQAQNLSSPLKEKYVKLMEEYLAFETPESKLVKDIDQLECALQAKEYLEQGYNDCQNWLDNIATRIKDPLVKELFDIAIKQKSTDWWKNLKKLD